MDATAVAIQKLIPAPQNNLLINNWQQVYPNNKTMDDPGIKVDHSLSDKMKLSFYFSRFADSRRLSKRKSDSRMPSARMEGFY